MVSFMLWSPLPLGKGLQYPVDRSRVGTRCTLYVRIRVQLLYLVAYHFIDCVVSCDGARLRLSTAAFVAYCTVPG
jgi:hypothetical protein